MSNTQNPVLLRHAVSQIAAQFSIHGIRRIHPRIHPVFSVSKLTRKSAESVSAHGSLLRAKFQFVTFGSRDRSDVWEEDSYKKERKGKK